MRKSILCLFSLCLGFSLFAQDSAAQEKLWEESGKKNPGLSIAEIKEFYQENAPDLLKELAACLREWPALAAGFLQQLVDGYRDLQKVRRDNPTLYQWQLRRLSEEVKIRRLGNEVKQLNLYIQDKSATEEPAKLLELHQKKQQLKKLLELSFQSFQQQQQVEINRLEAEMQMLKQLLEERADSKEMILQEQYRKLTGAEW
jgi:hypothetical protein